MRFLNCTLIILQLMAASSTASAATLPCCAPTGGAGPATSLPSREWPSFSQ